MARIRTIKPDFFTSADIVSLSPLARLLYIATWLEADREGRLAWRPRTFKLRYLPADDCDVQALCAELVSTGLVVLYGEGLASIPTFARHQHVNPRESASNLPDPGIWRQTTPPELDVTREDASSRVSDGSLPVNDAQGGKEGRERNGREGGEALSSSSSRRPAVPCPYDAIVSAYHAALPTLPRFKLKTEKRQAAMRKFWGWVLSSQKSDGTPRAITADEALAWISDYFVHAANNDFLMGRTSRSAEHASWECDFDFLLSEKGQKHVLEKTRERAA